MRLTSVLLLALAACGGTPKGPRGILLISIDTLRADHLGLYGYVRDTSPRLDARADEWIRFSQALSHTPKTAPSHMTMLTGLMPGAHGVENWKGGTGRTLSLGIPTLAERLSDVGFATAAFTEGGNVAAALGFDRGFGVHHEGRDTLHEHLDTAAEWLAEHRGSPRFLFLHTYAVHDPYLPSRPDAQRFTDPGYAGGIVSDRAVLEQRAGDGEWRSVQQEFWKTADCRDPADVRHLLDLYDAGIRTTDDAIGRFLDRLEKSGDLDDLLVVVTSDHGEAFGEHGLFLHETVFSENVRVPFLIRLPGGHSGGRVLDQPVGHVDLVPTLLEALGLEPSPMRPMGESLWPAVVDPAISVATRRVVGDFIPGDGSSVNQQSLREGRWRLVSLPVKGMTLLFDWTTDPGEQRDLATARPLVAERLRGRLALEHALIRARRTEEERGRPVRLDEATRAQLDALGYGGR